MVKTKHNHFVDKKCLLFIILCPIFLPVASAESLGSSIDCSIVDIKYKDNPEWTHNKRLEAMDKAFFESVDRFELCNLSNQSNAISTTGKGMSQAENSGNESGNGNGNELASTKNTSITGTETETTSNSTDIDALEKTTDKPAKKNRGSGTKNGAQPKDIPNANNDDVIAAQIRLAAEIEQDSVKKEKLWNEYRKYKGLPTQ